MKKHIGAAIMLAALATPAIAAQINVSVSGVMTSQGNQHGIRNTGVDANLSVGSTIILTASFDSSQLVPWGDFGYSVVGLYDLPTSGNSFFRIDATGIVWDGHDSYADGNPFYRDAPGNLNPWPNFAVAPALIIQGDKVIGIYGTLQGTGSTSPGLYLGSSLSQVRSPTDPILPITTSNLFSIYAANGEYANLYNTPGFGGIWDFANSSVVDPPSADAITAAIPEPATWAMFLIGFCAIGFVMRRSPLAI